MRFKLSNLDSNLALTLGYLNPALDNSALFFQGLLVSKKPQILIKYISTSHRKC